MTRSERTKDNNRSKRKTATAITKVRESEAER